MGFLDSSQREDLTPFSILHCIHMTFSLKETIVIIQKIGVKYSSYTDMQAFSNTF